MSCTSCNSASHTTDKCYEARLALGLSNSKSQIIGSIDGVYIKPVDLKAGVQASETNTSLRYDPVNRLLIYEGERFKNGNGTSDQISAQELLAGADISVVGGVQAMVDGGLASSAIIDGRLQVQFEVPTPVEAGEVTGGFVTYVQDPNNGTSYYRLIRPDLSGTSDTVLVGHPNGEMEFALPIDSPILVPIANLTTSGHFSGTPSVSAGTWRYQQMGQSQIITNAFGSKVEVALNLRWSMQTAGTRSGFYASLVSGGADYKSTFTDGSSNQKQEGYPGGTGNWVVTLEPNQRCQFNFGGWTNAAGSMSITVGSYSEDGTGTPINDVQQPIITIRRLI